MAKDKIGSFDVSIILNLYMPSPVILRRVFSSLNSQKLDNLKVELLIVNKKTKKADLEIANILKKIKKRVIKVNQEISFAESMNEGIKAVKSDIVVILQQDCIPSSENWLLSLCGPFKDNSVVASVSKVNFPEELWSPMSPFTKSIMLREKGTITPLIDEKGCAYRRKDLFDVGLFNNNEFHTAGEDFDMYLSLKKRGIIAYPDSTIIHHHPTNLKKRLNKIEQYSNGYGALTRIHGTKMYRWYLGFAKATPIIGLFAFFVSFPFEKGIHLYPYYLIITPLLHALYIKGFWKGYLSGKQTI